MPILKAIRKAFAWVKLLYAVQKALRSMPQVILFETTDKGDVSFSLGGGLREHYGQEDGVLWSAGNLSEWPDQSGRDAALARCLSTGYPQAWIASEWLCFCAKSASDRVVSIAVDATALAEEVASFTRQDIVEKALGRLSHDH